MRPKTSFLDRPPLRGSSGASTDEPIERTRPPESGALGGRLPSGETSRLRGGEDLSPIVSINSLNNLRETINNLNSNLTNSLSNDDLRVLLLAVYRSTIL